jgi:hypothetical protein
MGRQSLVVQPWAAPARRGLYRSSAATRVSFRVNHIKGALYEQIGLEAAQIIPMFLFFLCSLSRSGGRTPFTQLACALRAKAHPPILDLVKEFKIAGKLVCFFLPPLAA